MSNEQLDAYGGEEQIKSDPIGLWSRDNRNHAKKQRLILDSTAAEPGDSVLEVGCGHGLHAQEYARRYDYTGVDFVDSLVSEAREKAVSVDSGATVEQMDARALDYEADSFAAVVGTAVLHHLDDQARALREWQRVVRPGGTITLCEPNYLFPKDLATAHLVSEERHKTEMAPWRLRRLLSRVSDDWELRPCIYTPPWPGRFAEVYDSLDAIASRVPGARWLSQMLRIHIQC